MNSSIDRASVAFVIAVFLTYIQSLSERHVLRDCSAEPVTCYIECPAIKQSSLSLPNRDWNLCIISSRTKSRLLRKAKENLGSDRLEDLLQLHSTLARRATGCEPSQSLRLCQVI